MADLIWAGIWAMFLKNAIDIAQVAGLALAYLIFAVMCLAQLGKLYDWIKQECDLERLLDTPHKRKDLTKLEGNNTTFDFPEPEDEGPLTKMCPTCGERYSENQEYCIYKSCNYDMLVRRPITEPLSLIKPVEMLEVPTPAEAEDAALLSAEQELQTIWTALENKAREYNIKRPYTFSREEVLSLRKVYDKVREQSHEGEKAS